MVLLLARTDRSSNTSPTTSPSYEKTIHGPASATSENYFHLYIIWKLANLWIFSSYFYFPRFLCWLAGQHGSVQVWVILMCLQTASGLEMKERCSRRCCWGVPSLACGGGESLLKIPWILCFLHLWRHYNSAVRLLSPLPVAQHSP